MTRTTSTIAALVHASLLRAIRFPAPIIVSFFADLATAAATAYTVRDLSAPVGFDMMAFAALGMLTLQVMQGAANASQRALRDPSFAPMGFFLRTAAHPLALGAATIGSEAFLKSAATSVVALILSFPILHLDPMRGAALLAAVGIAALFGASFGFFLSALVSEMRVGEALLYLFLLMQFFLCGGLVPATRLPFALALIRRAMPFEYAVNLVRRAYFPTDQGRPVFAEPASFDVAALVISSLVLWLLAGRALTPRASSSA